MVKIKTVCLVFLIMNTSALVAQNALWLANGKKKEIGEFNLEKKDYVIYKNSKGKFKSIERFDVFAVIEQSGKEHLVYLPDTADNESFTIEEMRAFVQGQNDAHQKFKSPFTSIAGAGISGAAAVFLNPLYSPLVSGVYCGVIGATKTSEKKITVPKKFENSEHYLTGYKKAAKQKRIKNAIFGSLVGLAAGFATFAIINQSDSSK